MRIKLLLSYVSLNLVLMTILLLFKE